jgi:plasmid maintenance system antidote protein VapI
MSALRRNPHPGEVLRFRQSAKAFGSQAMRTEYSVNDMTIHRIVEQEQGFTPMLEFLPNLV